MDNRRKGNDYSKFEALLEIGLSRNKVDEAIGLAPGTLSNWVKDSEELGNETTRLGKYYEYACYC